MARLRIRIELNRGGVGVPLHKLASIVDESQKFFYLLAEDSHVDQTKGDWLGFDFGNESLNFTAEFVGPVTAEQVSAFHAAFDGTTSLRRTTIAQFARITEAIEQDELIGFGLFLTDDGHEPSEWRCLSRRDALRITEEIQLLIEASGEMDRESHLPAVANSGIGARLFSDRRERGIESAKWTAYVRDVEANMDRRISRVEHALEGQSGLIEDLHLKSTSTEDSVRKLLTAVEGFCAQTTRQLEAISAPAVALPPASEEVRETAIEATTTAAAGAAPPAADAAPPAADAAPPAADAAPPAMAITAAVTSAPKPETVPMRSPIAETMQEPKPAQPARRFQPGWLPPAESEPVSTRDWRLVAAFAFLGIGVVILATVTWRNLVSEPGMQRVAATSKSSESSLPTPVVTQTASPAPPAPPTKTAPPSSAPTGAHVNLEASELTWVAIRDAAGNSLLAHLFAAGDSRGIDLPSGATVRVGNAGGLKIVLNGNSIGSIGPLGKVRDVVFKNGSYKIVPTD